MIYDCFTFFNELDLLTIRLELYYKIVDFFVICECSKTQKNIDKPYYFEINKKKFDKYLDKIIYIKADNPPIYENNKELCWTIENYQRNQIINGLKNCKKNDIIFISDLDEFWNPNILKENNNFYVNKFQNGYGRKYKYKQLLKFFFLNPVLLKTNNMNLFLDYMPLVIEQDFYYYYINYKRNEKWYGTIMTKYKNITTIQKLRNKRNYLPFINNTNETSGWHFSYLGGIKKIKEKLNAIVEGGKCNVKDIDTWIAECLKNKIDLFNRKKIEIKYINPADTQFPILDYIKNNYEALIYIE